LALPVIRKNAADVQVDRYSIEPLVTRQRNRRPIRLLDARRKRSITSFLLSHLIERTFPSTTQTVAPQYFPTILPGRYGHHRSTVDFLGMNFYTCHPQCLRLLDAFIQAIVKKMSRLRA